MNLDFLNELLLTPSVSGHEEAAQQKILAYTKPFSHRQQCDATGNVLSILNPESPCKVLLCGHIDEIGFIVTHVQENGMLRLAAAGGVRPALYIGAPVQIVHEGNSVPGVVAVMPSLLKSEAVKAKDLVVDIGASSREEALQHVAIGDPVCADTTVRKLLGENISARALDDRSGAFVIVEAMRRAAEKKAAAGIYAATTVGEETTGRGAYYAASQVKPSCAIIVDVTWVSDTPETDPADTGDIRLGAGPVLCLSSIVNKPMNRRLQKLAEKYQIPVQWEIAPGGTSSDADTVNKTGIGVPVALVSIPLRYMHSSVEIANLRDLEGAIQLISEFLLSMDESFSYSPISV